MGLIAFTSGEWLFGAALPFITLYFFLPNEILDNTSYVPIPNKLITDYAFYWSSNIPCMYS